jgi:hypothetical protein
MKLKTSKIIKFLNEKSVAEFFIFFIFCEQN